MSHPSRGATAAAASLVLSILGAASSASANDPLAAQALYDDAKKLMGTQHYKEACEKFAESQKLDPGVGTHYALADCYEHAGRLGTAWVAFLDVVSESNAQGRADRAAVAKQRADALAPRVARIQVVLGGAAQVAGIVVTRDGEDLGEGQLNTAIPVDPGVHQVSARAPGKLPWNTSVDVSVEGKTFTVEVPALADAPVSPPPPDNPPNPHDDHPGVTAPASASSHGLGTQRILAIAAAGVGVVGLGVGSYFGLASFSKHSDAASHCTGTVCDPTGLADMSDGKNAATVSTILFIAGGALVAGGAVLWLTAPKAGVRAVPSVGYRAAGLSLEGAW